jgi:1-acyl-sn-glycerol-3-phosphate acyltransferase
MPDAITPPLRRGEEPIVATLPPAARGADPDPLRRRSARLFWLFGWYLHWYFWRRFRAVRVCRSGLPAAPARQPLIIYSNHPSWWDPALYILLCNKLFPGRAGYGPMDARSLGQYGVLEKMGVFGIELDSQRGAARFLETSLRVLADPGSILWITAEGHFSDARTRPVRLRPGIAHLARRVPGALILPLAIEYGFWNESRPEALARFGEPIATGRERSTAEWTTHLEAELARTMDALAAESAARNPALFRTLVRGGAGIGGVYDVWRRLRAWAAGHRFDPSHEGSE